MMLTWILASHDERGRNRYSFTPVHGVSQSCPTGDIPKRLGGTSVFLSKFPAEYTEESNLILLNTDECFKL